MPSEQQVEIDDDLGSQIHYGISLNCDIEGCNRGAVVDIGGQIHFRMDGEEYSRVEMRLCESHHNKLELLTVGGRQ
jgi:hypothetical protein